MNTICAADWTFDGATEPAGVRIDLKKNGSHQFVITDSGKSLEEFITSSQHVFDVVVADLVPPPISEASALEWKSWIHSTRSILRLCEELLAPDGKVILELSDSALLYTSLFTSLDILELVAWKKKYAPQNDSSRLIEPMHDFILVLGHQAGSSAAGSQFLPWQVAGKSEDGTREFQEMSRQLEIEGRSPLAIKPKALWRWCLENLCNHPKSVIDLNYSGHGLGDEVGSACEVTNVIWSNQADANTVISFVSARLNHALSDIELVNGEEKAVAGPCTCLENLMSGIKSADDKTFSSSLFIPEAVDDATSVICRVGDNFREVTERYYKEIADVVHVQSMFEIDHIEILSTMLQKHGIATVPALTCLANQETLKALIRSFTFVGSLVLVNDQQNVGRCDLRLVFSRKNSDTAQINRMRPLTESNYVCSDNDPRGSWRDPAHKGARSGSAATAFEIFVPPYRWTLLDGELPPGMWRLNSDTGIVWGTPIQSGEWLCEVQVGDEDSSVVASVRFVVSDEYTPNVSQELERVKSWLFSPAPPAESLNFEDQTHFLRTGVPQFLQLICSGGKPLVTSIGPPGRQVGQSRTRFWEFSHSSFLQAVCEDRAIWGRTRNGKVSTSRPRIKKFQQDEPIRNSAIRSVLEQTNDSGTDNFVQKLFPAHIVVEIDEHDIHLIRDDVVGHQVTVIPEVCTICAADLLGLSCSPSHALQRLGMFCGQELLSLEFKNASIDYRWVYDIAGQRVGVYLPNHILTGDLVMRMQSLLGESNFRYFGNRIHDSRESRWQLTKVSHR